jgi:hypothetical protein
MFNKSRTIAPTKQKKSTSETPGAQLHMLINISVKSMTLGQILFELRATKVENCKCLLSQGQ